MMTIKAGTAQKILTGNPAKKKREALCLSLLHILKEREFMLELEENMKTIKSAKSKLQELGESL